MDGEKKLTPREVRARSVRDAQHVLAVREWYEFYMGEPLDQLTGALTATPCPLEGGEWEAARAAWRDRTARSRRGSIPSVNLETLDVGPNGREHYWTAKRDADDPLA